MTVGVNYEWLVYDKIINVIIVTVEIICSIHVIILQNHYLLSLVRCCINVTRSDNGS